MEARAGGLKDIHKFVHINWERKKTRQTRSETGGEARVRDDGSRNQATQNKLHQQSMQSWGSKKLPTEQSRAEREREQSHIQKVTGKIDESKSKRKNERDLIKSRNGECIFFCWVIDGL